MSDVYQFSGSLPADSPTYVKRKADGDLYEALKSGDVCYVLNSRQMGKSSLRVSTMQKLRSEGFACTTVDVSSISSSDVTAQQWYAGIIRNLASGFNLTNKTNLKLWLRERESLTPVQQLSELLDLVLLTEILQPIIIFLDEIDSILSLEFAVDDFFVLIRNCYNKRADNHKYKRLTFAMFGVIETSDLIHNKKHVIFNIGHKIELAGFQNHEVQVLTEGLRERTKNPDSVMNEILKWTGGQPFLTQKVCHLVAISQQSIPENLEKKWIESLVRSKIIKNWESQDDPLHLRPIRDRILHDERYSERLVGIYSQILERKTIIYDGSFEHKELCLSGLVVKECEKLKVYNRIYRNVFDKRWISKTLENLQPFARRMKDWQRSHQMDNSLLLRSQEIEEALAFSKNKHLSAQFYQFLISSQDLEKQQLQNNEKVLKLKLKLYEDTGLAPNYLQRQKVYLEQSQRVANKRASFASAMTVINVLVTTLLLTEFVNQSNARSWFSIMLLVLLIVLLLLVRKSILQLIIEDDEQVNSSK